MQILSPPLNRHADMSDGQSKKNINELETPATRASMPFFLLVVMVMFARLSLSQPKHAKVLFYLDRGDLGSI